MNGKNEKGTIFGFFWYEIRERKGSNPSERSRYHKLRSAVRIINQIAECVDEELTVSRQIDCAWVEQTLFNRKSVFEIDDVVCLWKLKRQWVETDLILIRF